MKRIKRAMPAVLSGILVFTSAIPVSASGTEENTASEKEEVVYVMLDGDGSVRSTYVVNSFNGGDITDYGEYDSVKMMNTRDPVSQEGDRITFSSDADRVYYQGELRDAEIPWNITIRYYLDGKECGADELAGQSGRLEIHFTVAENEKCSGDFYQSFALQAAFTLDTERCKNISAPDATMANAGADKQLAYTVLPGEGLDTVISADVTDFEMDAVSINGIHLNLNIDIDDAELKERIRELIDAAEQIDSGASGLSAGAGDLADGTAGVKDGASSLHSGIVSLDEGAEALESGIRMMQSGIDSLNAQSSALVGGSSEVREALKTIQTSLDSFSAASENLSALTEASGQIRQALAGLYDGASSLQANLGYAQYKALMAQNGLDVDTLKAGNIRAAASLREQITALQGTLDQIKDIPGMEEQAGQIREQTAQLSQILTLLEGNTAAIGGMESYLDGISGKLPELTAGLEELKEQYETFDASVTELVNTLGAMTGNLTDLAAGINELAEQYELLDSGIGSYTDGVARVAAGYSSLLDGASALAEGSSSLAAGSGDLYNGTAELYAGVASLCSGARELADGTGEFRTETSHMDTEIEEEIGNLLEVIGGNMEDPVSFVSEKNTNVDSVQFVIQVKGVEAEEETATPAAEEQKEPSFLQKLIALFRRN